MKTKLPLLQLNAAESVIAPFHDPDFASELPIVLLAASQQAAVRTQRWDRHVLSWQATPPDEPVTLQLKAKVRRSNFDHLIFCVVVPAEVEVRMGIKANGILQELTEWRHGSRGRMEITAPLPEGELSDVQISARLGERHAGGEAFIELLWFGLGNSDALPLITRFDAPYGEQWEGLMNLPKKWPETISFKRGLLFDAADLSALRAKSERPSWAPLFEAMTRRAKADLSISPETWIGDHLPWTDTRYLRTRELGAINTFHEALVVGFVGLVSRDLGLARQALRHLLTIVHTGGWTVSDDQRLQGSNWDQRCFHEEMASTAVALLTDWYAWALTPRAHELIAQALWDKGLSVIERDMMKFDYVYKINQGPWFCRARILGGLILETTWPRLGTYVDRAKADMLEGLNAYLLEDGGTDEGVGYFAGTLETTLGGLLAYARARSLDIHTILPAKLSRSGDFIAALSAVRPGRFILDGDSSNDEAITDVIPMLASLFPEQVYTRIAAAALPLPGNPNTYYRQYFGTGVFALIAGPDDLPPVECIVPEFARLPVTGHITSLRRSGVHTVRLHFAGAKANASHTHLDKGNFTVELDGHPFLVDRGITRYDDARTRLLKESSRHNVITPVNDSGLYLNQATVTDATIPEGYGDSRAFHAEIDLANVWRNELRNPRRRISSDHALEFSVEDWAESDTERPMAFHLQALRPFELTATGARLVIAGITLEVEATWAASISQAQDGINCHLQPVHHLVLHSAAVRKFHFETRFRITFPNS